MLIKNLRELNSGYDSRDSAFINVALSAYEEAINAVDPYKSSLNQFVLNGNNLSFKNRNFNLDFYNNIYVIGAGKAGFKMAKAMHDLLGERITEGCVCVPVSEGISHDLLGNIRIMECSHPIPDMDSVLSARMISRIASKAGSNDLVIFLLSGGASSLMCLPVEEISLSEKQSVFTLLLKSGADISEINTVRKHISGIKGGKLAKLAYPAEVIQLVISDVMGNSLDIIGSGPVVQDKSTFNDAIDILKRYSLWDAIPESVSNYLSSCSFGRISKEIEAETMNRVFDRVYTSIIGDNHMAVIAASKYLEDFDFKVYFYPKTISDEASLEAKELFLYISKIRKDTLDPFAVIAGGEPVVSFKRTFRNEEKEPKKEETNVESEETHLNKIPQNSYKSKFKSEQLAEIGEFLRQKQMKKLVSGGRSQEFALAMLKYCSEYKNSRHMFFLAAGTDGIDGPTDAAGAIITPQTFVNSTDASYDITDYLERHDSYAFFNNVGGLIKTGYTGTNVNDIFIALVPPQID